jgi:hypothetical protein
VVPVHSVDVCAQAVVEQSSDGGACCHCFCRRRVRLVAAVRVARDVRVLIVVVARYMKVDAVARRLDLFAGVVSDRRSIDQFCRVLKHQYRAAESSTCSIVVASARRL